MTAHLFKKKRTKLSAIFSKELLKEYGVRSMQIRTGDTVKILRGAFKGVEGKITKVNSKTSFINVEGATIEKSDGTVKFVPIHHSKVEIKKLNLSDPRRKDILERRAILKRSRRKGTS